MAEQSEESNSSSSSDAVSDHEEEENIPPLRDAPNPANQEGIIIENLLEDRLQRIDQIMRAELPIPIAEAPEVERPHL